ncbi:MAG: type II toxin-antitoxin system VapC family toxin [Patulibacter sp.]
MILADTSVWIDHLRFGDSTLTHLLGAGLVLGHPWVIGELALGNLSQRHEILGDLTALPTATGASDHEVLEMIERHALHGRGIGYADAQLLASTLLTPEAYLWTRDKRLALAAADLGVEFDAGRIGG